MHRIEFCNQLDGDALVLTGLKISTLHGNIAMSFLKYLYCNNNDLTEVDAIKTCQLLEVFHCENNKITHLPNELGILKYLQSLRCNNNCLTKIPDSIKNIQTILIFNCDNNPLETITALTLIALHRQTPDCSITMPVSMQNIFPTMDGNGNVVIQLVNQVNELGNRVDEILDHLEDHKNRIDASEIK